MGDFWDALWQQTYQVNPSFSFMCARSELRKQWKFTWYGLLPPSVPKSPIPIERVRSMILPGPALPKGKPALKLWDNLGSLVGETPAIELQKP